MAGFPFWQLDRFLKILVQDLNKPVALSNEIPLPESERLRSGDPQYERKVVRVVTPGTLIDEQFLDPNENNFLLSIQTNDASIDPSVHANEDDKSLETLVGLAWLDLSTGDFFTQTVTTAALPSMLLRISPREILLPLHATEGMREAIRMAMGHSHELTTPYDSSSAFVSMADWNSKFEVPVPDAADQVFPMNEKLAGHRLLDYLCTRLIDLQLHLRPPQRKDERDILSIDRGSLRGLEILETAKDGLGKGSLFHAVKRTVSKGGSRLLRDRLTAPSSSLVEINDRLDLVTEFHRAESLREGIVNCLRRITDVKRLVQKFALSTGTADDMLCLARAITETSRIHAWILSHVHQAGIDADGPLFKILDRFHLSGPTDLGKAILDTIDEEGLDEKHRREESEAEEVAIFVEEAVTKTALEGPNLLPKKARPKFRTSSAKAHYEEIEDPWIIRRAASEMLERLHLDLESLKVERDALQTRLQETFKTQKLELKWTPGLGHICHLTSIKSLDKDTLDALDGRMLSLSKSTRSLYLPEWSRLGEALASARRKIRDEESRIFRELRKQIIQNIVYLRRNAAVADELDVATSFAALAQEQGWTRPKLNDTLTHKIVGGRHPTVKLGLEERGRTFVTNDLLLGEHERVWIVTGPNMAGKSTFLRQNALITILAQVGCYVPAEYAEIGIVDRIFSRIGAADDLFRDQSTFMVEMLETAAILKNATPRSFVIMDEVGRGTTPEDGVAVSFSSLHHLHHVNKCRTLFATHFHALIDMTEDWVGIGKYCTDVLEDNQGSFSFVHKLRPGVNRQSHALKVARMAGMPRLALDTAMLVQKQMTAMKHTGAHVLYNEEIDATKRASLAAGG